MCVIVVWPVKTTNSISLNVSDSQCDSSSVLLEVNKEKDKQTHRRLSEEGATKWTN